MAVGGACFSPPRTRSKEGDSPRDETEPPSHRVQARRGNAVTRPCHPRVASEGLVRRACCSHRWMRDRSGDQTRPTQGGVHSHKEEAQKSRLGPLRARTGGLVVLATRAHAEARARARQRAVQASAAGCADRKKTKRPDNAPWLRYQSCIKGRGQMIAALQPTMLNPNIKPARWGHTRGRARAHRRMFD